MKQYTHREFVKIIESNDFMFKRSSGSHSIFVNIKGNHITVPKSLNSVIAHRLIKENKLKL